MSNQIEVMRTLISRSYDVVNRENCVTKAVREDLVRNLTLLMDMVNEISLATENTK